MSCDVGEVTKVWRMSRAHSYRRSRAHPPTFQSLHLRHNSFSDPSVALSTSQLILQPFRCFTNVTAHSPTLLSVLLRHRLFTYVTWRAAHAILGLNSHYRLWGTKAVKFWIGTLVRKHTAPRYKQNITTSHIEPSHFCCLLYVIFLLNPLRSKVRCDDQRLQHMSFIYESPWNQRKSCWRELRLWRMLDYQILVIVCTRTRYVGTMDQNMDAKLTYFRVQLFRWF